MSHDPLHDLGARIAAEQDRRASEQKPDQELELRLVDRVRRLGRRTRSSRGGPARAWILLAAALGILSGGLVTTWLSRDQALGFTVGPGDRPGDLRRWHEAGEEQLAFRFDDGSSVMLDAGARGRVVRTDAHGADVVVEGGRARVQVTPRASGSWSVQTGPFLIEVKGTEFDVAWDAAEDQLSLDLYAGRVVLSGCGIAAGRVIEAGHRVRASCREPALDESRIAEDVRRGPQEGAAPWPSDRQAEPAAQASEVVAPALGTTDVVAPSKSTSTAADPVRRAVPGWRVLAQAGRYGEAYEVARAAGFSAECERAGAEDLALLADVARLANHGADASAAYLVLRRRFPSSAPAARAAFMLGRAAFQRGDAATTVRWMETSLTEHPGGSLAPASVELLLEAALRLGDSERARAAAARYLKLRPTGPHAAEARRLVGDDAPRLGERE